MIAPLITSTHRPIAHPLFGDWSIQTPHWLWALCAIPLLALLLYLLNLYTQARRSRYLNENLVQELAGHKRRWLCTLRVFFGFSVISLILITLARPQSNPEEVTTETKGREVVFLLDVSRSMLAKDIAPDRLEKAKLWINDLVDHLKGDQVGLVAFSGASKVVSPLTSDRLFFKLALEELSPDSIPLGGTNVGDAIRKTMDLVFVDDENENSIKHRDLILISDGEDQDSLPIEAARLAAQRDIRIISIGIGSREGAMVPRNPKNTDPNQAQVQSKLESSTLRSIASATPGGVYLEVGTGTIDLAQIYEDLIASADQHVMSESKQWIYTERFTWFLYTGLGIAIFDALVLGAFQRRSFR